MTPADWIEHRRSDGVHVGWAVPAGEDFHAVDLLGRRRTEEPVDWFEVEQTLDALGIGYLADRYRLVLDGRERRVRIGEVSPDGIVVLDDDLGDALAIGSRPETFTLPFPAPEGLQSIG